MAEREDKAEEDATKRSDEPEIRPSDGLKGKGTKGKGKKKQGTSMAKRRARKRNVKETEKEDEEVEVVVEEKRKKMASDKDTNVEKRSNLEKGNDGADDTDVNLVATDSQKAADDDPTAEEYDEEMETDDDMGETDDQHSVPSIYILPDNSESSTSSAYPAVTIRQVLDNRDVGYEGESRDRFDRSPDGQINTDIPTKNKYDKMIKNLKTQPTSNLLSGEVWKQLQDDVCFDHTDSGNRATHTIYREQSREKSHLRQEPMPLFQQSYSPQHSYAQSRDSLSRRKPTGKPMEELFRHTTTTKYRYAAESNDPRPTRKSSPCRRYLIAFIAASLVASLCVLMWTVSNDAIPSFSSGCTKRSRSSRLDILHQKKEILRKHYPSIKQSAWNIIAGSSWTHVTEHRDLERPVVLLLVDQPGKATNVIDFASGVAGMYADVYSAKRQESDIIYIAGANLHDASAADAKRGIHRRITSGLDNCSYVALITDVDKLPPCSAILFHGFCDNDSAPYKDAVFIFTMRLAKVLPSDTSDLDVEKEIQDQLQHRWSRCPEEFPPAKIVALQSRIANNIVLIE